MTTTGSGHNPLPGGLVATAAASAHEAYRAYRLSTNQPYPQYFWILPREQREDAQEAWPG